MDAAARLAQQDQWEADALAAVRVSVEMLRRLIEGGFDALRAQEMVSSWWGSMYPDDDAWSCDCEDDEE